MSIRHLGQAWQADVKPIEKLVLLAIANHAGEDGIAWPSVAQLGRVTGLNPQTISRATSSLAKKGFLSIRKKPGAANFYEIQDQPT